MSPGATFERVYRAIKDQLGGLRYRPGDQLEPATLADELNSSITPVRDALHRLVGETLVEAPPTDGFRVPLVTEVALRHAYAWNNWLADFALRSASGSRASVPGPVLEDVSGRYAGELFLAIARGSGNPEHEAAVARLNDRLRPVRTVEERLLGDTGREAVELLGSLQSGDRSATRRLVARYHRLRIKAAPLLVEALHRPIGTWQTTQL
jgi:hypothetical protein